MRIGILLGLNSQEEKALGVREAAFRQQQAAFNQRLLKRSRAYQINFARKRKRIRAEAEAEADADSARLRSRWSHLTGSSDDEGAAQ